MNFAGAVTGRLSRSVTVETIQSQAETELNRKLSEEELAFLSTEISLNVVADRIHWVL